MTDDVTIPHETARLMADAWRAYTVGDVIQTTDEVLAWADLLDPRPTLRDAVAQALRESSDAVDARREPFTDDEAYAFIADAALTVVRDRIAALPVADLKPWEAELLGDEADVLAYRTAVLAALGAES